MFQKLLRKFVLHRGELKKLRFNYLALIQMLQTFVYDERTGQWELHLYVHKYDSSFPCSWTTHGICIFRSPVCHVQASRCHGSSTIPEALHRGLLHFLTDPINSRAATSQTRQPSRSYKLTIIITTTIIIIIIIIIGKP